MLEDEEKNKICKNDPFKKLVINYQEMDSPDYAILLDGKWGSGKTYYIQNFIKDLSNSYSNYNFLYYSLNGISDAKNVITNIFLKLALKFDKHSYIFKLVKPINKLITYFSGLVDNKKARIAIDSVSTVSEDIFQFVINSVLKKQNKINNSIVFLDDLERISNNLDITDLLGNLHNFFLDNNIKIVYIADETKLLNNESYKQEKEKYIKRTYKFKLDKYKVFNTFIHKEIFKNLNKKILMNSVLEAFPEEQPNLRTVKYAFNIFEEIVFTYESFSKDCKYESVEVLFYSICCYSNLYANGNTNKNELLDVLKFSNIKSCFDDDSDKNEYEKFIDNCNRNNLFIVESVIDFIFDGLLNSEKLLCEMLYEEEVLEPLFEITTNLYKLETSDLKKYINQILQNLRERKYSIKNLLNLTNSFVPYCKQLKILEETEISKLICDSIFDDNNKKELNDYFKYMQKDSGIKLPSYDDNFNDKIKDEYIKFKYELESNYTQEAFKVIDACNYDVDFFRNREDLFLFSELEKNNKLKDLLGFSNKSLYFIISIIKKNILSSGNPDYYKSEIVPLTNLLNYSNEEIVLMESNNSDDILRIKALKNLNQVIQNAVEYIKSYLH